MTRALLIFAALDCAYRLAPVSVPFSRAYVRRSLGIEVAR